MQTTLVKPKVAAAVRAASCKAVSGRPNGGQRPRAAWPFPTGTIEAVSGRPNGGQRPAGQAAEAREWDSSHHFGLDVLAATPPRSPGVLGALPLVRLENPGHSWVFAHLSHVAALGAADAISECSYIVGSCAALEEDCDAPALADAIGSATGRRFDWDRDATAFYDGLFEWDYAYENFEAGRRRLGRDAILMPYDSAAAMRIVSDWRPSWEAART